MNSPLDCKLFVWTVRWGNLDARSWWISAQILIFFQTTSRGSDSSFLENFFDLQRMRDSRKIDNYEITNCLTNIFDLNSIVAVHKSVKWLISNCPASNQPQDLKFQSITNYVEDFLGKGNTATRVKLKWKYSQSPITGKSRYPNANMSGYRAQKPPSLFLEWPIPGPFMGPKYLISGPYIEHMSSGYWKSSYSRPPNTEPRAVFGLNLMPVPTIWYPDHRFGMNKIFFYGSY
jgi:hypothetical protein